MLETTPLIPDLMPESTVTDKGFQSVLEVSRTPHRIIEGLPARLNQLKKESDNI